MAALFGSRVRRLRDAAGLTQAELARKIHVVSSRIAQIERACGAKPSRQLARALDEALNAESLLIDLWPFVYREAFPDWSRAFMAYAEKAVVIREYAASVVPGLLQTKDYARAVLSVGVTLRGEEHLRERLAARLDRQERLTASDRPDLWVVLDEAVLRRAVGGRTVMRRQLERLLRAAQEPNVTVQVLPFSSGEHDVLGGSLTVLTLPDGAEVAYREGAHHGHLTEEPEDVRNFALAYDRIRAAALPPRMSLDMIRAVMEDDRGANVPSRAARRKLAQKQLQQSGGRQLRGGGRRVPRPRPRT
ncbi:MULTISPECIES: helix-turn-helix domain-containing protein [unclassified Streptomyces]|uniref:helix-turn-helix domain-containing protein n=1 Tax=unclassified Streptomyces TaxID=2593676 RepID=UPI0022B71A31|nr:MULTISPECIES: helix-turn-helix transcriptional regulator [unclassified Streptomyces]MCZ7415276.1 helix-turn-helix transcriptional regulator [Streptomyces sp. WMMC897]MCZ7432218.1 helix-turn-helix transcriptional regulator [Streptomyces sp. WMMC1477]